MTTTVIAPEDQTPSQQRQKKQAPDQQVRQPLVPQQPVSPQANMQPASQHTDKQPANQQPQVNPSHSQQQVNSPSQPRQPPQIRQQQVNKQPGQPPSAPHRQQPSRQQAPASRVQQMNRQPRQPYAGSQDRQSTQHPHVPAPQQLSPQQAQKQGGYKQRPAVSSRGPAGSRPYRGNQAGRPFSRRVHIQAGDNVIFVGQKPAMSYVMAVMTQLGSNQQEVHVRARGQSINKAVDVVEIVRNRFVKDLKYGVTFETASLQNRENRQVNVSVIDIKVEK